MSNVYLFGTDKSTCLRGMTTIDAIITIEALETFFFLILTRIQHPDNRREHAVGTEKVFVTAQAGRRTAEAVYTPGSINIFLKEFSVKAVVNFLTRTGIVSLTGRTQKQSCE